MCGYRVKLSDTLGQMLEEDLSQNDTTDFRQKNHQPQEYVYTDSGTYFEETGKKTRKYPGTGLVLVNTLCQLFVFGLSVALAVLLAIQLAGSKKLLAETIEKIDIFDMTVTETVNGVKKETSLSETFKEDISDGEMTDDETDDIVTAFEKNETFKGILPIRRSA